MSDIATIFILMLATQTGDGLSLTKIRDFPTVEACRTAAAGAGAAIGEAPGIAFLCVSGEEIAKLGRSAR